MLYPKFLRLAFAKFVLQRSDMNAISSIEALEPRIAPAGVLSFTDVDGDLVTIRTNKGTTEDLVAVTTLNSSGGGLRIDLIDLAKNPVLFTGVNLTVTADKNGGGGDGVANVGRINALKNALGFEGWIGLGKIVVDGDLHEIDAGAFGLFTTKPAFVSLSVGSFGDNGFDPSNSGGNGTSTLIGKTGPITVTKNFGSVSMTTGNIPSFKVGEEFHGTLSCAKLTSAIIGSIRGGTAALSGSITAGGGFGNLTVVGDVEGGGGTSSGSIIVPSPIIPFIPGFPFPQVNSGTISIGGKIEGSAGEGSGRIDIGGYVERLMVNGSVFGGTAKNSGGIRVGSLLGGNAVGTFKVSGDVFGSDADYEIPPLFPFGSATPAAQIHLTGNVRFLTIGGTVSGSTGDGSGVILINNQCTAATLGSITNGGEIIAATLKKITVNGNVEGTASRTALIGGHKIGTVAIQGNVDTALISASAFSRPYFVSLSTEGSIGPVTVTGNWTASSIVASVNDVQADGFGDADDALITAFGDDPLVVSKIGAIIINGTVSGSAASGDSFGFVAQQITSLKINGTNVPLTAGPANDLAPILVGGNNDVSVREIGF